MPRRAQSPLKLNERNVMRQVKDFLQWRWWRYIRLQSGMVTSPTAGVFRVGERGMPDACAMRFFGYPFGAALVLFIEFKAPNGRLRDDQIAWHSDARRRGAKVWVISSLECFEQSYAEQFGWLHRGERAVGQGELDLR